MTEWNDSKCYVCQKDTLKKYICKNCYFELFRENERLNDYIIDLESDIEELKDEIRNLNSSILELNE